MQSHPGQNVNHDILKLNSFNGESPLFKHICQFILEKSDYEYKKEKHFTPFHQVRRRHKREMSSKRST